MTFLQTYPKIFMGVPKDLAVGYSSECYLYYQKHQEQLNGPKQEMGQINYDPRLNVIQLLQVQL